MWGFSLTFWEAVFVWSTLAALIFGGLGVTGAFISTFVGYKISGVIQKDADARIADAKLKGDLASASAADAKNAAANAMVRAADLERDAANARLETERLKAQLAWRNIPETKRTELAMILARFGGSVTIGYIQNDPESIYFAGIFYDVFKKANAIAGLRNWQIKFNARIYSNTILAGLYISGSGQQTVNTLRDAFRAQNIQFSEENTPDPGVHLGHVFSAPGEPLSTDALIMVGSKPPPF